MTWDMGLFLIAMFVIVVLYIAFQKIDKQHRQRKLDLLKKRQRQLNDNNN